MADELIIDAKRVIPAHALEVKTARASGPGGQHVNRTETKVHLSFDPRMVWWIDDGTRLRIVALAGRAIDSEGRVLITSQEHREKERNLATAREKLVALVTKALVRPKKRIATKPSKAQKRRRLEDKRRIGDKKSARTRAIDD